MQTRYYLINLNIYERGDDCMKNKVLRAISCVLLSAMLVVEVAIPTQAAVNECQHVINNGTKKVLGYLNADYTCHQVKASIAGI